jgi:hypothetical protein
MMSRRSRSSRSVRAQHEGLEGTHMHSCTQAHMEGFRSTHRASPWIKRAYACTGHYCTWYSILYQHTALAPPAKPSPL